MIKGTNLPSASFYGAEIIQNRDLWFSCGGSKSEIVNLAELTKFERFKDINPLLMSDSASFDLVTINSNNPIRHKDVIIKKSENLRYNLEEENFKEFSIGKDKNNDSQKISGRSSTIRKRRRGNINPSFELGIHIEILSKSLKISQEGLLHYVLIKFINEIKGVEYYSSNYSPNLKVSKIGQVKTSIIRYLSQLGKRLIDRYIEEFSTIEKIQITFWLGFKYFESERINIEQILIEKRKKLIRDLTEECKENSNPNEILILNLMDPRTPFYAPILFPGKCISSGMFSYTDINSQFLDKDNGSKNILKKIVYKDEIDKDTGEILELNQFYRDFSFNTIPRIQLWALDYPLPTSPNSDLILISIPLDNTLEEGLIILERNIDEIFLENYSYQKIISEYANGHQTRGILGMSRFEIISEPFRKLTENWNKICFINKNLRLKIQNYIPTELLSKIPTEDEVANESELNDFLNKNDHPIVENEEDTRESVIKDLKEKLNKMTENIIQFKEGNLSIILPHNNSKYEITLKNVKLKADSIFIKKLEK